VQRKKVAPITSSLPHRQLRNC